MKSYYVYILASDSGTLYTGVTNDLLRRVYEHREGLVAGFTRTYGCKRLVYYEIGEDVTEVIAREKRIKGWSRWKKEVLIRTMNPKWEDLYTALSS